jgi:hypothetical protein
MKKFLLFSAVIVCFFPTLGHAQLAYDEHGNLMDTAVDVPRYSAPIDWDRPRGSNSDGEAHPALPCSGPAVSDPYDRCQLEGTVPSQNGYTVVGCRVDICVFNYDHWEEHTACFPCPADHWLSESMIGQ